MPQRPIGRSREIHLLASPPLQGLLRHIGFRGEFHGSGQPLPEVPLSPIEQSRDIHLTRLTPFRMPSGAVVLAFATLHDDSGYLPRYDIQKMILVIFLRLLISIAGRLPKFVCQS